MDFVIRILQFCYRIPIDAHSNNCFIFNTNQQPEVFK